MMKSFTKILLLILLLNGCSLIEKHSSKEKEIINCIVRNDLASGIIYDTSKTVLIFNKTISPKINYLKSPIKEHINDSVFVKMQNYLYRNNITEKTIKLKHLSSNKNIIIVNDMNIYKFYQPDNYHFKESVWGLMKFSNPVYSKVYNLSFVYRVVWLSPLGGWGELIILTKNENKWEIIHRITVWVS